MGKRDRDVRIEVVAWTPALFVAIFGGTVCTGNYRYRFSFFVSNFLITYTFQSYKCIVMYVHMKIKTAKQTLKCSK